MADLQGFISQHDGQYVDFDGYYGAQCVDLAQYWSQALGGPKFTGNAADIAGQTHGFYSWIENTPQGIPEPGDIVIWGGALNGGPGHIAIFVNGNAASFNSFDQNWPLNSACHVQGHNYNYVVGWLRPPGQQGDSDMWTNKLGVTGNAEYWGRAYDERNDQWVEDQTKTIPALQAKASATNPVNGEVRDAQGWFNAYDERNTQWQQDEAKIADLTAKLKEAQGKVTNVDPSSIIVTQKGWQALFDAIKSFFSKNN